MKNRYLKGAHISERKVRELLKLFCEDLTATQIANISGISRITVNAYLKLIRMHIAKYCEESNPVHMLNGNYTLNGFDTENRMMTYRNGTFVKKSFYGIFKHHDTIHTDQLIKVDPIWLYDWLKGRVQADPVFLQQSRLGMYSGVADFNSLKLFRVNMDTGSTKGRSQIDEIDLFWGLLKSRLVKFRGLNGNTLYLHVKETEFRYNNRQHDLFELLVSIIHKRPLHLSRL
jgi:transposase